MNILECEKGENFTTVSTALLIDWLKHQILQNLCTLIVTASGKAVKLFQI